MPPKRVIPEKRRAPREKHDSVLELFDQDGAPLPCVAVLADLSSTGASFWSTTAFAKGAVLRARLRVLGQRVLEIEARVVRFKEFSNHTLYGVAFDAVRARPEAK